MLQQPSVVSSYSSVFHFWDMSRYTQLFLIAVLALQVVIGDAPLEVLDAFIGDIADEDLFDDLSIVAELLANDKR